MEKQQIPQNVHLVGIGGVGTSSLAQWLLAHGHRVSGSDRQQSQITQMLCKKSAKVFIGHKADNVGDAQLVVRSSAVPLDNEEVVFAQSNHIPVLLREELLGAIFNSYPQRVAICGTHGKTTVTAMVHHILQQNGVRHACFIGGLYNGSNFFDGEEIAIVEACEYKKSFLQLHPTICCCLNVEYDHPDCYADENDVLDAFACFAGSATNHLVTCNSIAGKISARTPILYDEQFVLKDITCSLSGTVCRINDILLDLPLVGRHNLSNAQAAIAVCGLLGVSLQNAITSLATFKGVDRRWTVSGANKNIVVDYAHHPTEIASAVQCAMSVCSGDVYCLFQPHTFTRTKAFWHQFATCFKGVRSVGYLPVFAARERPIAGVSSSLLARHARLVGIPAVYFSNMNKAALFVQNHLTPKDILLVLGAGDICDITKLI